MPKISALPTADPVVGSEPLVLVQDGVTKKVPASEVTGFDISALPDLGITVTPSGVIAVVEAGDTYKAGLQVAIGKAFSASAFQVNSSESNTMANAPPVALLQMWATVPEFAYHVALVGFVENETTEEAGRFTAEFIAYFDDEYLATVPWSRDGDEAIEVETRRNLHVLIDNAVTGVDIEECLVLNLQFGGELKAHAYTANTTDSIRWRLAAEVSPMGAVL
jgi:hypothetical protein